MSDIISLKSIKGKSVMAAALILFFSSIGLAQKRGQTDHPIGKVHFPISCSDEAQQEFNRGVELLHHMTYPQAKTTFQRVAEVDPQCAMAYWGMAMTLFQPLWPTRPGAHELHQGWESIQKAKTLAPGSEREQLFIASAEAFFLNPEATDYWERVHRWEQATETVYQKFPGDPEAKAFFALAHLATAQASENSIQHHDRAAEILLSLHEVNPIHPGSIHYLIHANDIRGREHESLEVVRSYGDIAPRNPHALHMPTHIFTRLGSWQEVIDWNHKAAEAALEHPAGDRGEYVWDEFPHAIEYLVYAYLQQGDDEAAAEQFERVIKTENLHPTFKTAFHLSSIPARYALEREDWREAADLVPRSNGTIDWDLYPWPEAVTWYAKGLGASHLGHLEEVKRAEARLQVLEDVMRRSGEKLFTQQIQVLKLSVSARAAFMQGRGEQAIKLMKEAADLELATPKHPITPAPTLPAHELLGSLLMELGKPGEALAAFKFSLELYPQRFNALLGAARAAKTLGDNEEAKKYYTELLRIGSPDSKREGLKETQTHLGLDTGKMNKDNEEKM